MSESTKHATPPLDPGLASLVLGSIGLLLFFLPILGGPLAGFGVVFGLGGAAAGIAGYRVNFRRAIQGMLLSSIALGLNAMLYFTPFKLVPDYRVQPNWQTAPDSPWVSPPAMPGK